MKYRDALAAGIAHLSQNRLRAGLSILGIFIGIASVLCMMAIGDGAKQIIADDIEKIGGQIKSNSGHALLFGDEGESGTLPSTTQSVTLSPLRQNVQTS